MNTSFFIIGSYLISKSRSIRITCHGPGRSINVFKFNALKAALEENTSAKRKETHAVGQNSTCAQSTHQPRRSSLATLCCFPCLSTFDILSKIIDKVCTDSIAPQLLTS
jgi:hypothetical protein